MRGVVDGGRVLAQREQVETNLSLLFPGAAYLPLLVCTLGTPAAV